MPERAGSATAETIAERFVLDDLVGRGAFGEVLRAVDSVTGKRVAIKRMLAHARNATTEARFDREARMLAQVRSEHVVDYVAHGIDAEGRPWLAQEWLEGIDLAQRAQGGTLPLATVLDIVTQVALGLDALHRRGIIHRDVKPANVFLLPREDGRHHVKLIDLGIARSIADPQLTQDGMRIGSPAYMSPEQARGDEELTPRSDLYSLGVVAFELLSARRPFTARDPFALLAKLVIQDAPLLRSFAPSVSRAVESAVARALSRLPAERYENASAMAAAFRDLASSQSTRLIESSETPKVANPRASSTLRRITGTHRLVTAVFAAFEPSTTLEPHVRAFAALAEAQNATVHQTLGSRSIAVFGAQRSVGDETERAARMAIRARAEIPGVRLAISTCRVRLDGSGLVGEAIDTGAAELARASEGICVDGTTARLLELHYRIDGARDSAVLRGERVFDAPDAASSFLGRTLAMVGRERQLAALESDWARSVDESQARAVSLVAPAGAGKTRLAREFVRRVRASHPGATIWAAHGDPLGGMSALGLIAEAVRGAMGVRDGDPVGLRRVRVLTHVTPRVAASETDRVARFLGELIGTSFDDSDSLQLRAARLDPMLMGDQIGRAFEDWLAGECAAHPVLLLLEDTHWGDAASIQLAGRAIRNLYDRRLMVLASTRPEHGDGLQRAWPSSASSTIVLSDLSTRACESFAREALGEPANETVVHAIAERSAGNPFHLEELVRAVIEGRTQSLPDTVLSSIQARLDLLEPSERSLVCAASVFGRSFWADAVATIQTASIDANTVRESLERLCDRELIVRRPTARYSGQSEYGFRHALVRDAAYECLRGSERTKLHARAAAWFERVGEADPVTLAEHWERGQNTERAAECYRVAAEQSLSRNDFRGVLAHVEKAVACGASGVALGELRYLQGEAFHWRGEDARTAPCAREAVELLPPRSAMWHQASIQAATACSYAGDLEPLFRYTRALIEPARVGENELHVARGCARVYGLLRYAGRAAEARAVRERLEQVARRESDPLIRAWVETTRCSAEFFDGGIEQGIAEAAKTIELSLATGDLRRALLQQANRGGLMAELGAFEEAEAAQRESLAQGARLGVDRVVTLTRVNLGKLRATLGHAEEGLALIVESIPALAAGGDRRAQSYARSYASQCLMDLGRLDEAETEARGALTAAAAAPSARAYALAVLARVLLRRGVDDEALEASTDAMGIVQSAGGVDTGEGLIRLVHAEALRARGRVEEARMAITSARDRLTLRAAAISSSAYRQSFLERIPEHAATLQRAVEWADPAT